jgi:YggT family protein
VSLSTASAIAGIVDAVAQIIYVLILARIVVSWIGLNPWNPVVHWLRVIVDPILRPFRRVLPTFGGIDFSPLLAILVIFFLDRLIKSILFAAVVGGGVDVTGQVLLLIRDVILNIIIVLGVLVLIRLLLSLFHADPFHPLVGGIRSMTNVLVRPFAFLGPRSSRYGYQTSSVDVPAIATLVLYIALYFVVRLIFRILSPGTFGGGL